MDRTKLTYATSGLLGPSAPEKVVAVGIHWQRGIVSPDDAFGSVFAPLILSSGIIPRVAWVFRETRRRGGHVAHVSICNPPQPIINCPLYSHAKESGALRCGSPSVETVPEVGPMPEDWQFEHHRASIFFDTDLSKKMEEVQAEILVVSGVATNVAVEGSVRDASDRGLKVVVLSDCCIAVSSDRHENALKNMEMLATEIMTADEYVQWLKGANGSS